MRVTTTLTQVKISHISLETTLKQIRDLIMEEEVTSAILETSNRVTSQIQASNRSHMTQASTFRQKDAE